MFFLVLLLLFGLGIVAQALQRTAGLAWSEVFALLLPATIAAAGSNLRPARLLGLLRPRASQVAIGALVGGAGFLLANGVMDAWTRLLPARVVRSFDVAKVFEVPFREQVVLAILASTVAPLCEEAAFRGYLQRTLALRVRPGRAILVVAVLFATLHLDPVRFPALVVLGAVFGWLAWRAGSTWPAIAAHAANNALASGLVLALGAPEATAPEPPPSFPLVTIAVGGLALAFLAQVYAAATPAPPPPEAAVERIVPEDPSTRFAPSRIPPRLWAAAWVGLAMLAAMLLLAPGRR